jgi:hypothetical protein
MGKGKKKKEGYSLVKLANRHLPFQLPYMNPTINWGSFTVLRFRDEAIPGAVHTLVAAQGVGSEVAEDKDQDFVCQDVYLVPFVGGLLLHVD